MKHLSTGKKIGIAILAIIIIFLIYVACKPNHFHYERRGGFVVPAEKVFPYLRSFKKGSEWNPYEKKDPNMKKTYFGTDGEVGSAMEFEGNKDVGSGRLEMLKIEPNHDVEMKLTMLKPFKAENIVRYRLKEEHHITTMYWTMDGENGFLGKLISTFINCDEMVGKDFIQGILNLQNIINNLPKEKEKPISPAKLYNIRKDPNVRPRPPHRAGKT